jgi:hypothetical protein
VVYRGIDASGCRGDGSRVESRGYSSKYRCRVVIVISSLSPDSEISGKSTAYLKCHIPVIII